MSGLTVGSLFAGIGGFDLGLERAGMRVIWQSEIDPYASAVLRKHWPLIPNHGDIRTITADRVVRPDVLCGGFPCQDISSAGNRAGINGPRSGLWREFARIVGELRPRFVIVENVATLLNRGMGDVVGDLAALGYDAEWHGIPAAAAGANHRRDRVWVVAYPDGRRQQGERLAQHGDKSANPGVSLTDAVRGDGGIGRRFYNTPCAGDSNTAAPNQNVASLGRQMRRLEGTGGLNPTWVEWLMGFPLGWTALDALATPSSRKSPRSSDAQS